MVTLTREQCNFLKAEGKIILCSCPGSGKTFIVVRKLLGYVKEWSYAHRGVAVLSFTNIASDEIRRQISEPPLTNEAIAYPHFNGTLDSFINNFIFLRFGYLMPMAKRKRPQLIHEDYGGLSLFSRHSECHRKGCTQDPYAFHWSPDGKLLRNNRELDCTISDKPCVSFKRALLRKGLATQKEVASLSLLLLKRYPQIARALAYRFPVIIVDEAQDTSREQMEILETLFSAGGQTLILVGDPDQAIYEWRDAEPEYFISKMNDPSWETTYLSSNFRSSQRICNATSLFSHVLSDKKPAFAQGETAAYGRKPILLQVNADASHEDILQRFQQYCIECEIEYSHEKVAVLTRRRIHAGTDIKDLWKGVETQFLARATYEWHCGSRMNAYRLCEKALYNMTIGDVQALSYEEMRQKIEYESSNSVWKKMVIAMLECLPSPLSSLHIWKKLLMDTMRAWVETNSINLRNNNQLSDIIKLKSRDKKNPNFLEIPLLCFFEKKAIDDVTVSSIHGVKGMTFDAVLLMVDSTRGNTLTPSVLNNYPLTSELIRIAYVAMTRPRRLLVVSIPRTKVTLSRFPAELWEHAEI